MEGNSTLVEDGSDLSVATGTVIVGATTSGSVDLKSPVDLTNFI